MAAALVDYARAHSVEPQPDNVDEFKDFPGEGIFGKSDGQDVYVGNQKIGIRAWCSQGKPRFSRCCFTPVMFSNLFLLVPTNESENNEGNSISCIFLGSTPVGIFSLSDSCRISVKEALEELKYMGIRTAMLTGDCQDAADHAQNQVNTILLVLNV
ncbi:putative P-type Zn(2+) transporter [Helianthus anomalus]